MKQKYTHPIFLLMALMCWGQLIAQSAGSAKKYSRLAEKQYMLKQWLYAIPMYKAALKKEGTNTLTLSRLADCYWQIKNVDSALRYYKQYEAKGESMDPPAQLRYAELLAQNNEYDRAVKILDKVEGNSKLVQARKEGFMHPEKFTKDPLMYRVQFLNINSLQSDYSPQFYGQGIVYLSGRVTGDRSTRRLAWNGNTYSRVYQVKDASLLEGKDTVGRRVQPYYLEEMTFNDDDTRQTSNDNPIVQKSQDLLLRENLMALSPSEPFANSLQMEFNNGPVCFNKEQNLMYFTRNRATKKEGVYNLEICSAVLQNGEWGQVQTLAFSKEGYDYFHPALSADGSRLFFCSNQPGGVGGTDIYSIAITDPSATIVNETSLNTAGNELFPAFHGDTLYFSSDGYAGLGGLDIYRVLPKNGTPENIGTPFNSSYDDFGLVYAPDATAGLFTSNRLGSDDLYSFSINPPHMNPSTIDSLSHIAEINRNREASEAKNAADNIARRRQEELARLKQQLEDYYRKLPPETPMLSKGILFETAKDELLPESKRVLDEVKTFMDQHPAYLLMIEGHADIRAEADYNLELSIKRAASVRRYLISKGIAGERLISKGYGITRPIAPNGTLYGRQLNRRVEMKSIKL